jgi:hypothetical protein
MDVIKPQSIEIYNDAIKFAEGVPELQQFKRMIEMIREWTKEQEIDDVVSIVFPKEGEGPIRIMDQAEEVIGGGQKGGAIIKCSSGGVTLLVCTFIFILGMSVKMTGNVGGKGIYDFILRALEVCGDEWTIVWIRLRHGRFDLAMQECKMLASWLALLGFDIYNAENSWATLHGRGIMGIVNFLRKICIMFNLTYIDRTEELTIEQNANRKAVDDAFSLKVNVQIGTNFADYTLDQLVEIITERKIPNTQNPLSETDFDACQAGILRAIKMGKATIIANPKLKGEYEKIAAQKTLTIAGEVESNEDLAEQIIAIANRRSLASSSSTSAYTFNANANPKPKGTSSPSARAKNSSSITSYFPPAKPPGGGGKRSRRRMPKSKRGGRSRMRKMRTKKRRMSKRKYRR